MNEDNQPSCSVCFCVHVCLQNHANVLLWSLHELQQLHCQIPDVKLCKQGQTALHTQVTVTPQQLIPFSPWIKNTTAVQ